MLFTLSCGNSGDISVGRSWSIISLDENDNYISYSGQNGQRGKASLDGGSSVYERGGMGSRVEIDQSVIGSIEGEKGGGGGLVKNDGCISQASKGEDEYSKVMIKTIGEPEYNNLPGSRNIFFLYRNMERLRHTIYNVAYYVSHKQKLLGKRLYSQ